MSGESFDVPNWEEIRTQIVAASDVDPQLVAMDLADKYDLVTLLFIRARIEAELSGKAPKTIVSEVLGGSVSLQILEVAILLNSLGRKNREIGKDFLGKEE